MIISFYKPPWKNDDDEKCIEIELRWPKAPPRGYEYIQSIHIREIERLLDNARAGKKPVDAVVAARRMLRRATTRFPR